MIHHPMSTRSSRRVTPILVPRRLPGTGTQMRRTKIGMFQAGWSTRTQHLTPSQTLPDTGPITMSIIVRMTRGLARESIMHLTRMPTTIMTPIVAMSTSSDLDIWSFIFLPLKTIEECSCPLFHTRDECFSNSPIPQDECFSNSPRRVFPRNGPPRACVMR